MYDKVQIIENKNIHSIPATLEGVRKKLPKNKFVQIHRQFAVALDHIDTVSPDGVTLTSVPNLFLPISRKYYPVLMKRVKIVRVVVRKAGA